MITKLNYKTTEEERKEQALFFWEQFGLEATKAAFKVGRSILFVWKKQQREGRLAAQSRRPKDYRQPEYTDQLVSQISAIRLATGYGKEKLTAILKRDHGLACSCSTVGRIIRKHQLPKPAKKTKPARTKKQTERLRKPKDFQPQKPGELVGLDTIVLHWFGIKLYVMVAIDWYSRLALARCYKRPSSKNAADLLARMQVALGVKIQAVNTDNGSEFLKNFSQACEKLQITHYFNYPRCPKMNAITERFNRTLQEDTYWPEPTKDLEAFNKSLAQFILTYNFYRPHHSLSNQTPVKVFLGRQSNMYWTHTRTCGGTVFFRCARPAAVFPVLRGRE